MSLINNCLGGSIWHNAYVCIWFKMTDEVRRKNSYLKSKQKYKYVLLLWNIFLSFPHYVTTRIATGYYADFFFIHASITITLKSPRGLGLFQTADAFFIQPPLLGIFLLTGSRDNRRARRTQTFHLWFREGKLCPWSSLTRLLQWDRIKCCRKPLCNGIITTSDRKLSLLFLAHIVVSSISTSPGEGYPPPPPKHTHTATHTLQQSQPGGWK